MLEFWAHKDTPLLNRISWGEESGGIIIEWVHENLGWMYVETSAAIASGGTAMVVASTGTGHLAKLEAAKQVRVGTLLYAKAGTDLSQSGGHAWMAVSTIAANTCTLAFLSSTTASIAASAKVYIVGSFANEGSEPDRDTSRARVLLSNKMTILRKDIQITGSEAATDMHAVPNELNHQIKNRLLELQFERERSVLYSWHAARAAVPTVGNYGLIGGMAELLLAQSTTSFVDDTTTTLTESTFNNVVAECFDNGGRPNVAVGSVDQIRKFTNWNTDRIRTTVDNRIGGQYISQYLTDTGITVDLIPLIKAIPSFLFILDTEKLKLRAKKGRKLLLQKLGLKGDLQQWQIISEYSLEHHGIADGHHGAFTILT